MRTLRLLFAAAFLLVTMSSWAGDPPFEGCIPASERAGRPVGCFILASQPIGKLEHPPFWHLETFATSAAAEKAKGSRGVVLEAFDKVWLLTIAEAGWRSQGGTHVAEIGPIPAKPGRDYTAQFMEAVFSPGMKARTHVHSGAEAWYTLSWRDVPGNTRWHDGRSRRRASRHRSRRSADVVDGDGYRDAQVAGTDPSRLHATSDHARIRLAAERTLHEGWSLTPSGRFLLLYGCTGAQFSRSIGHAEWCEGA